MISKATIVRFVEAFVAVFIVAFGASAVFSNGTDLFGAAGLQAIAEAAVAAALLAIRRVMVVS
jgi:hypothetical protein